MINFALILVCLCLVSLVVIIVDKFILKSANVDLKEGLRFRIVEHARSFFPILFTVLILRSFLFEPFRIPSSSLEPTLLTGDFILVNKFSYGLRLPVLNTPIVNVSLPKRGDIMVFRWPVDPRIDYIKRAIGIPGDHVVYHDKILTINGKKISQRPAGYQTQQEMDGQVYLVEKRIENLNGKKHAIYLRSDVPATDVDVIVPPHHYFAMGDNRDNSSDSRYWGFVPEENLLGRAEAIWMSWDKWMDNIRWKRIGTRII